MNFEITTIQGMNLRANHGTNSKIVGSLISNIKVEGDVIWTAEVADPTNNVRVGDVWLKALLVDNLQPTTETWMAVIHNGQHFGTLITNPVVDPGLAVRVEISFISELPVGITLNGVPIGEGEYSGTIVIKPVG